MVVVCYTIIKRKENTMAKKKKLDLKELRIGLRLTQEEFAEEVGVSLSLINKVEQGKRSLSLKTARIIEQKFGITLDI